MINMTDENDSENRELWNKKVVKVCGKIDEMHGIIRLARNGIADLYASVEKEREDAERILRNLRQDIDDTLDVLIKRINR